MEARIRRREEEESGMAIALRMSLLSGAACVGRWKAKIRRRERRRRLAW